METTTSQDSKTIFEEVELPKMREPNRNKVSLPKVEKFLKMGDDFLPKLTNLVPEVSLDKWDEEMTNFHLPELLSKKITSDGSSTHLPFFKMEQTSTRIKNRNNVRETKATIAQLENDLLESSLLLENEKLERFKVQEEMCREICNCEDSFNKNASEFLKMCCYEENFTEEETGNDKDNDDTTEKKEAQLKNIFRKNFIRRNIELSAKAMSRLPITDEEKQQLQDVLADIDQDEKEKISMKNNAFGISEDDKKRLCEIDLELEDFEETSHLKFDDSGIGDDFWKTLALDQMMRDIDAKLDRLENEENILL